MKVCDSHVSKTEEEFLVKNVLLSGTAEGWRKHCRGALLRVYFALLIFFFKNMIKVPKIYEVINMCL